MRLRSLSAGALALCASACSPTLDWREVRPEGSGALALFPCKPVGHARDVTLAGTPVRMSIHACKAGDTVYALGFADVGEPARVTPALRELRRAAAANLGAQAVEPQALAIKGSTPKEQAGRSRFDGRRPDGSAVHEALALFARGTRVYQATVLGAQADMAAVQTFFDGLEVLR